MNKLVVSLVLSCSLLSYASYAGFDDKQEIIVESPSEKAAPVFKTQGFEAPNLDELQYEKHYSGGSGGVHVFKDSQGLKWTLKGWFNTEHGAEEIIASEIFTLLGLPTPASLVFKSLPEKFSQYFPRAKLFRISPFLEGTEPSPEIAEKTLSQHYLSLALLSFWDGHTKNLVQNKFGQLFLIDTGGSLIRHALGKRKAESVEWSAYQISELETFSKHTLYKGYKVENALLGLNDILKQANLILDTADQVSRSLKYPKRIEILNMLTYRLRHLQLLDQVKRGVINPIADAYAKAGAFDAAGAILYTMIGNEPHMLVGQRVRHNWWGNLGGKVDPNESFFEAAAREIREESGGVIKLDPLRLKYEKSHDLLTFNENKTFNRFRNYLVGIDYVDPTKLENTEYTGYAWIPVRLVLEALENSKTISEEGQSTIAVGDKILHPPFLQSLMQPQIKNWLRTLVGEKTDETYVDSLLHTQGVHGMVLTPTHETWIKTPDFNQGSLNNALRHDLTEHKLMGPFKDLMAPIDPSESSTLHMIKKIGGKGDSIKDDLMKVSDVLKDKPEQALMIENIIKEEANYPDKYVLYHGTQSNIWFCYRVLSILRHMLDKTPLQTDVLRSMQYFFDEMHDANSLREFIENGNSNYSSGFQRAGVSCNPTLASNLNSVSSDSIAYFLNGSSQQAPTDPWAILQEVFKSLNLDQELLSGLKQIFKDCYAQDVGALLQIFLDEKDLGKLTYVAGSVGSVIKDSEGQIIKDPVPVLKALKNGDYEPIAKLSRDVNSLQVRLHGNLLQAKGQVLVKDYMSDGSSAYKADEHIIKLLSHHIEKILESLSRDPSLYKHQLTFAQDVGRKLLKIADDDLKEAVHPIITAHNTRDLMQIYKILSEDPDAFNCIMVDPDTFEEHKIADTFVKEINFKMFVNEAGLEKKIKLISGFNQLATIGYYDVGDLVQKMLQISDYSEMERIMTHLNMLFPKDFQRSMNALFRLIGKIKEISKTHDKELTEIIGITSRLLDDSQSTLGSDELIDFLFKNHNNEKLQMFIKKIGPKFKNRKSHDIRDTLQALLNLKMDANQFLQIIEPFKFVSKSYILTIVNIINNKGLEQTKQYLAPIYKVDATLVDELIIILYINLNQFDLMDVESWSKFVGSCGGFCEKHPEIYIQGNLFFIDNFYKLSKEIGVDQAFARLEIVSKLFDTTVVEGCIKFMEYIKVENLDENARKVSYVAWLKALNAIEAKTKDRTLLEKALEIYFKFGDRFSDELEKAFGPDRNDDEWVVAAFEDETLPASIQRLIRIYSKNIAMRDIINRVSNEEKRQFIEDMAKLSAEQLKELVSKIGPNDDSNKILEIAEKYKSK